MITNMNLNAALEGVRAFNVIAGNFDSVTVDNLKAQLALCKEELQEATDDLEAGNHVGTLDGAVDMFVTTAGFMLQLEKLGFDVNEALVRVNANNLSKYPTVQTFADDLVPEGATATFNRAHGRWVMKDVNGKVKKPTNFVSVDIGDLAPAFKYSERVEAKASSLLKALREKEDAKVMSASRTGLLVPSDAYKPTLQTRAVRKQGAK